MSAPIHFHFTRLLLLLVCCFHAPLLLPLPLSFRLHLAAPPVPSGPVLHGVTDGLNGTLSLLCRSSDPFTFIPSPSLPHARTRFIHLSIRRLLFMNQLRRKRRRKKKGQRCICSLERTPSLVWVFGSQWQEPLDWWCSSEKNLESKINKGAEFYIGAKKKM